MSCETPSAEQRLERGEVIYYPECPFPYPQGDDRDFLNGQRLAHRGHKNVSYDPYWDQVKGGAWDAAGGDRVRRPCRATPRRGSSTWSASAPRRSAPAGCARRRATTCCTWTPSPTGRRTASASCGCS
jgi:hypothetical protein